MFGLISRLKGYAFAALAAIGAVLFALIFGFMKGSKSGANGVLAKTVADSLKSVATRNEIEAKIQRQPEGQSAKDLKDKWARD